MSLMLEMPPEIAPVEEADRLAALRSLQLLDTPCEERFDRVTRLAADFFGVPMAYVALVDSDRQWYKSSVGMCSAESDRDVSFCQYTIRGSEPLIMPDTLLHPLGRNHPLVVGEPFVRFYAGVPLAGPRGRRIGSFCLADKKPRAFGPDQVERLRTFAALIEREVNLGEIIQVQDELLATRQQLVQTQAKLSREVQDAVTYVRTMLPPPLDDREAIDWIFEPSTDLGGDGFGYRRIDDDRLAFYMIDVTGHGLGSALLAVTALELLRSDSPYLDFSLPGQVLERVNRIFQMRNHAGKFLSAWYGVYSRSAGTITYGNAGHPPPLLLRHDGGRTELSKTEQGSTAIGILPELKVAENVLPFPPGSELFLFTDGIYELSDGQGGRGSYDDFVAKAQAYIGPETAAWEALQHWLDRARDKHAVEDDVTLLRFTARP